VRGTLAVARAESLQGNTGFRSAPQSLCPAMLQLAPAAGEPDLPDCSVAAQVVYVPVGAGCSPAVVSKAGRQATWPASAANVGVETGRKLEHSQRANSDTASRRRLEDHGIGARRYRKGCPGCSGQRITPCFRLAEKAPPMKSGMGL
jgi:hypothetical protein